MLNIIIESGDGNSALKFRRFPLGDGIKKHLLNTLQTYKGDKTNDGYKRLNNILAMDDGIAYNEMKRIKHFFDNFEGKPDNDEYILNGGEPMKLWVNNTLNTATGVIRNEKEAKKAAGLNIRKRNPNGNTKRGLKPIKVNGPQKPKLPEHKNQPKTIILTEQQAFLLKENIDSEEN